MKRILVASILGCSVLVAASSAFAGQGYLVANVTLRAGPDMGYPGVVGLRAGTPVGIEGCVDGWSWCDVTTGNDRGWVSGNYLQEEYQGQRVLVPAYGVQIGIPIVTFVFGNYWDNYYSGRHYSWYGNREHWSHVQPHYSSYGGSHGPSYGGSYGGSHGTSYDSSYGGSHATSYGGSAHYVAPNQAHTSSSYRTNGSRHGTVVTTQPDYQSRQTQSTYQSGYTQSASQGRQTGSVTHSQTAEGRHTGSVTHTGPDPSEGRNSRSYANTTSVEHDRSSRGANAHNDSPRSNETAQHGHGQSKTVAEGKHAPKTSHKDGSAKPEKDNGGGKDKNRN
jgi:uncharacterized protein YraI